MLPASGSSADPHAFLLAIVCVGVLNKLASKLGADEKSNPELIEQRFRELCLETKKAENRFVSSVNRLRKVFL